MVAMSAKCLGNRDICRLDFNRRDCDARFVR
jgi:hypothetical protein